MINYQNRLKKNKHFQYIYKHGTGVKCGFITLVFIKAKVKPFKVGFSVGSKVGKSVQRNKVKRQMKEAFSQILPLVDRRYNYIFVAKPGIVELDFHSIKQNMLDVVKKAGLFNEQNN